MAEEILYCATCGKRIPPEEAETEDFRVAGGEPACEICLEKAEPGRKRKLLEVRSTRLRWRVARMDALAHAQAPKQTYPAPGTEAPPRSTDTAVAAIRKELEEDLEEVAPAEAARELGVTIEPVRRPRYLLWWCLLVAGLVAIVAMLLLPNGVPGSAPENPVPAPGPAVVGVGGSAPSRTPRGSDRPPLSAVQVALAEVELIRTQVGDAPSPAAAEVAMAKLQEIADRTGEPARSAALSIRRRYEASIDARVRQTVREAAERAEDLAAQQWFEAAVAQLRDAVRALPPVSPWAQREGRERLVRLIEHWSQERRQRLSAYSARLESELAVGNGGQVESLVAELARHPEREFQDMARAYANQLAALREREEQQRNAREAAARTVWPQFFASFDRALALRDFDGAAALCLPDADSALRSGGVAQPEAVLSGFGEEVERVRALFPLVLQGAAQLKGERVQLRLTTGQVEGVLTGVQDAHLLISAGNRIEVRVSPDKLSSEALAVLLRNAPRVAYGPGLAALRFVEHTRDAEDRPLALSALYQELGKPLPVCWAQRFELERRLRWRDSLAPRLDALRKAVADGRVPAVRDTLAQLRPLLAGGPLTRAEENLVAAAGDLIGASRIVRVVFQNGRLPAFDFQGLRIDQIGAYHRNVDQCDFDMQQGLRVGSSGDLLRVLVRFDGLVATLGRGRVLKATLEMYQVEGPATEGAVVSLHQLKRAWVPDAGSWTHADRGRKLEWEKPGASGAEDVESVVVAQTTLDRQVGLWRSWDLTEYLGKVLDGRAKNLGLMMRVVKDEPRFLVRFYPDGEPMPALRDPALRPRLVVEFEKFGP